MGSEVWASFAVFYAVLFSALLNAEISSHHFKKESVARNRLWWWRVAWLVGARGVFLAAMYYVLPDAFSSNKWEATLQVFGLLLMCAMVLTFQQISYLKSGAEPPRVMHEVDSHVFVRRFSKDESKKSWLQTGICSGLITVVGLVLVVWFSRKAEGGSPMTPENVALALGVMSLLISVVALGIAIRSDQRMKALSNLHFQEKLAVFASYLPAVERDRSSLPLAERMRNDLAAVSHLKTYASRDEQSKLIRDYVIPILRKYLSASMEQGVSIAVKEMIDIAFSFGIELSELENLRQRARGLS